VEPRQEKKEDHICRVMKCRRLHVAEIRREEMHTEF